jgi:hypothetical protein
MAKFKGADKHLKRLRGMTVGMRREATKLVMTLADMHATEAALLITTGGGFGQSHVVSKPGQPPNADTGALDRSVHAERVSPLKARSVADAPHAVPLEFGTSEMAERPFMRPAAKKVRKEAKALSEAAVRRIKKGGTL